MNEKSGYRFPEEIQAKLNAHVNDPALMTLRTEIALLKTLMADATEKNPRLAIEVSNALVRAMKAASDLEARAEILIPKSEIVRLAQELIGATVAEFSDLPDWEIRVERLANRFSGLLVEQPPKQIGR